MFSTLLAFIIKGENQAKWRIGGLFMPNCQNLVLDSDPLFCYNFMAYPGIAEVVQRHIWDVEIVRSSRTTRTKSLAGPLNQQVQRLFLYLDISGPKQ